MALDDDIATLSQAPLFNLLERDALRLVAFASENRTYREGGRVFKKGGPLGRRLRGEPWRIALDASDDSSPEDVSSPVPAPLIGQAALFARIERRATATAREPSAIIRVTPSLMRRVLEGFPGCRRGHPGRHGGRARPASRKAWSGSAMASWMAAAASGNSSTRHEARRHAPGAGRVPGCRRGHPGRRERTS